LVILEENGIEDSAGLLKLIFEIRQFALWNRKAG
jgi:hypothetical protein